MKNFKTNLQFALLAIIFLFSSCEKCCNDPESEKGEYYQGTIILNEGSWGNSNASVSFVNKEGEIILDAFSSVNQRPLGDLLQSMAYDNDNYYFVLNGSNKIEVVDRNTFESKGVISEVASPRYAIVHNGKLFVSQWGQSALDPLVLVFDLETMEKLAEIKVDLGPERMILVNDDIWVVNSGGWSKGNSVSIIDTDELQLIKTLTLNGDNPIDLNIDGKGNIAILCSGDIVYNSDYTIASETPSKLIKINVDNYLETKNIILSESEHPSILAYDKSKDAFYFGGGYFSTGIYFIGGNASIPSFEPIVVGSFYGFNLSNIGDIYLCRVNDWTVGGEVLIHNTSDDSLEELYNVGIGPNTVVEVY
jgi:DNA-binding beta-propeller fold protein YncE